MRNLLASSAGAALFILAACASGPPADMSGTVLFGTVAQSMDASDKDRASKALTETHEAHWNNPSSGNHYDLRIDRDYSGTAGTCRDYTLAGVVGGKRDIVVGSACRKPDGTWAAAL
jgi:surface antigen